VRFWAGFVWFKTGIGGGFPRTPWWTIGFYNRRGTSSIAERLLTLLHAVNFAYQKAWSGGVWDAPRWWRMLLVHVPGYSCRAVIRFRITTGSPATYPVSAEQGFTLTWTAQREEELCVSDDSNWSLWHGLSNVLWHARRIQQNFCLTVPKYVYKHDVTILTVAKWTDDT
jgi:hypothetical protein